MKSQGLARWWAHPLTAGLVPDDPRATQLRREIIRGKPFLKRIYQDWYARLAAALPPGDGPVLEIGSGAGFCAESIRGLIASEIFFLPGIDVVLDAQRLPVRDQVLRGIVMTDVFHHIPRPGDFLREAARTVRKGGVVAMIEPWRSIWSEFVYRRFHPEPFEPGAVDWELPPGGPLTGANGAMPWIVFERDRRRFEAEHTEWHIRAIQPGMPLRYLLSGGVSLRALMPGWMYSFWGVVEAGLHPLSRHLAMFAWIVLERV